jgi:excisionase family DNA binding protein
MADTFYTLPETATKLGKSENAIKDMVKNGELREYRDGANVLFKTEDVDKLAIGDIDLLAEADEANLEVGPSETGEISLASSGGELNIDEDIFALSDTTSGKGPAGSSINILGETDSEFRVSEDTKAETKGLKLTGDTAQGEAKIDEDVSLDSFGSGSGLLDLSLQADDTSLGAEVLEDIYSPDAAGGAPGAADLGEVGMPGGDVQGDATAAAATDDIFDAAGPAAAEAETETDVMAMPAAAPAESAAPVYATAAVAAPVYTGPQVVDPQSGVFSALLIIGLFVMAFTMTVAFAGARGISASAVKAFSEGMFIWYVVGGLMLLSLAVLGIGVMVTGRSGQPKAPKAPKAPKPAKARKEKK